MRARVGQEKEQEHLEGTEEASDGDGGVGLWRCAAVLVTGKATLHAALVVLMRPTVHGSRLLLMVSDKFPDKGI